MGCQHLEDLHELFLLGALSDATAAELRDHLERHCASCLERIREAAQTVYLLSLTTKTARPNPKLKLQLLRRLRNKS
jgi:hypothetical protein